MRIERVVSPRVSLLLSTQLIICHSPSMNLIFTPIIHTIVNIIVIIIIPTITSALGFSSVHCYLPFEERATLAAIEQYVERRHGETWRSIRQSLEDDHVTPTEADGTNFKQRERERE